jgi:hypothetical protein
MPVPQQSDITPAQTLNAKLSWLLPSLIIVAAVVGVASALVLKTKNPRLYEVMGRHRGDA